MPVLYVHGVNTRSRAGFEAIEPLLRRFIAPAISDQPSGVPIRDYYWGDMGVKLAWGGASRPRTQLLGLGPKDGPRTVESALAADAYRSVRGEPERGGETEEEGPLTAPGESRRPRRQPVPVTGLTPRDLSDLLVSVMVSTRAADEQKRSGAESGRGAELGRLILAADKVAQDTQTPLFLAGKDNEQQLRALVQRVREEAEKSSELAGKGLDDFWAGLKDRLGEALTRAGEAPGYFASVLAAELRPGLNEVVSNFLGDVFVYLHGRDDPRTQPGAILKGLGASLKEAHKLKVQRGNEPLVVVTHSMGGQLVWDALTSVLPADASAKDVRVDYWCATASQVGFFQEAGLFMASGGSFGPGKPVPFPSAHLGTWWNVWDYNDFLSFTAKDICAGVDDGPYVSGSSLLAAHGAYLERPSFYRELAAKLEASRSKGFVS